MNKLLLYHGVLMEDIWRLPHMKARHSPYGMLLKDWEHLFRRGLGGISLLKWSLMGDYFFTAKLCGLLPVLRTIVSLLFALFFIHGLDALVSCYVLIILCFSDGTFYLWETNTWTSEPWSSTGGFVTGATWDPEGRMILIAFSESVGLGSIHFASRLPSLDAHLLPVDLPEVASLTGSQGIEKIAWDASGERLALSYKRGDEMYNGLVAIYDVRRTPLISASLVGFIRGPGENPKPLAFAFHDKLKHGPLLSVCWSSGWCCSIPLCSR